MSGLDDTGHIRKILMHTNFIALLTLMSDKMSFSDLLTELWSEEEMQKSYRKLQEFVKELEY